MKETLNQRIRSKSGQVLSTKTEASAAAATLRAKKKRVG